VPQSPLRRNIFMVANDEDENYEEEEGIFPVSKAWKY
jgi:hypothetical protein